MCYFTSIFSSKIFFLLLCRSVRVCNSSPAIAVEISSFTRCPTGTTVTWIALQIKDVVSRMLGMTRDVFF